MKKIFVFFLIMIIALGAYGCAKEEAATQDNSTSAEKNEAAEKREITKGVEREIVDLGGNVVKVPPVEKLNRVVILSPPISSIQYSVLKDTSKIVAAHPFAFKNANPKIVKAAFKNFDDINTTFIKGFNVDTEAILNLKPDIVFYYGPQQKKGLENLKIPIVDFMKPKDRNPVTITTEWERVIREIYDVKGEKTIKEEWNRIDEKLKAALKKIGENKLKGLMIFDNSSSKILISGSNTYGDYWLEMSGLINVADNTDGYKEVSMEQIYEWNPDIIYLFMGEDASNYAKGIKGQDWSRVNAVKENRVYNVPKGVFAWAAPGSDSPLVVQWMLAKNYPSYFKGDKFKDTVKQYYKDHYNMTLTDEMLDSILKPNKERE